MRLVRAVFSGLVVLLRALLVDLWKTLFRYLMWLWRSWRRLFAGKSPEGGQPLQPRRSPDCIPMSHPAFKVPDPLIYSQEYIAGLGHAVTWDNPDIVLRKDGVDVPSAQLQPDTVYEIVARIWNNSPDAPIVDLPVSFSYLAFGIGTQSHAITDPQKPALVTLGVKGGPNHPAFAVAIWRTPPTAGHYCIQVRLDPASDANYGNNLGQENTQVGQAESPADFAFILRNSTPKRATVRFEADSYTLPNPPACGRRGRPAFNRQAHARARYPVPAGWRVDIDPPSPLLEPGQERAIAVTITPPVEFVGTRAFNINAFTPWSLLGGVTLHVKR